MVTIKLLKAYKYRGAQIFLRQIGQHTFEYIIMYKRQMYINHFNADEKGEGKKMAADRVGGAAVLIANAAEGTVDVLAKKKSLMYNLLYKYFDLKMARTEEAVAQTEAKKNK